MILRSPSSLRRSLLILVLTISGLGLTACDTGEGNTVASLRIVDASGNQPTGVLEIPRCVPTQLRVFATFDDGGVERDFVLRDGLILSSNNPLVPISNGDSGSEFFKGVVTPAGAIGDTAIIRAEFGSLSATQEVRIQRSRLEISTAQAQMAVGELRLPVFLMGVFGEPGAQTVVDISERAEWRPNAADNNPVEVLGQNGVLRFFVKPKKTSVDGAVDPLTVTADTGVCGSEGEATFAFQVHNKPLVAVKVQEILQRPFQDTSSSVTLAPVTSGLMRATGVYGAGCAADDSQPQCFEQDVTQLAKFCVAKTTGDLCNSAGISPLGLALFNRVTTGANAGNAVIKGILNQFAAEGDGSASGDVSGSTGLVVTGSTLSGVTIVSPIDKTTAEPAPKMINGTTRALAAKADFVSPSLTLDVSQDVLWTVPTGTTAVSLQGNLVAARESNASGVTVTATARPGLGQCGTTGQPACPAVTASLTTNGILQSLKITAADGSTDCSTVGACTVAAGGSAQLRAIGTLTTGEQQELTAFVIWETNNANASVNNAAGLNGLALGRSAGTSTVTARFGSIAGSGSLTVN
jgi:hypothetical protein